MSDDFLSFRFLILKKKCNNKKYSLLEWHCKMRYWEGHKHFKIEQLYRTAKLLVQLEFIRIHFFRKCMETSLNFLSSFTLYDIFIYGRAYFSFFNICRFPFSTIFARLELCVCHYFFLPGVEDKTLWRLMMSPAILKSVNWMGSNGQSDNSAKIPFKRIKTYNKKKINKWIKK